MRILFGAKPRNRKETLKRDFEKILLHDKISQLLNETDNPTYRYVGIDSLEVFFERLGFDVGNINFYNKSLIQSDDAKSTENHEGTTTIKFDLIDTTASEFISIEKESNVADSQFFVETFNNRYRFAGYANRLNPEDFIKAEKSSYNEFESTYTGKVKDGADLSLDLELSQIAFKEELISVDLGYNVIKITVGNQLVLLLGSNINLKITSLDMVHQILAPVINFLKTYNSELINEEEILDLVTHFLNSEYFQLAELNYATSYSEYLDKIRFKNEQAFSRSIQWNEHCAFNVLISDHNEPIYEFESEKHFISNNPDNYGLMGIKIDTFEEYKNLINIIEAIANDKSLLLEKINNLKANVRKR